MREIINGKAYDTETAKKVAGYANYGDWRDFRHFEEALYQKKTGEYFLFGEGGPLTEYAEHVGLRTRIEGCAIKPLTHEEAAAWAEKRLDAQEYERIFGPVAEDDSMVAVSYKLSASTAEWICQMADRDGISQAEIIEKLVGEKQD